MIRVLVQRNQQNSPASVEIKGHALFAAHGTDIVCAAVSVLVQTVVFALDDLLELKPPLQMDEGYLFLGRPSEFEQGKEDKYNLLIETMLLGLQAIARSYAGNVTYREETGSQ